MFEMFTCVSPNRIATRSFPFFHSFLFYFSFVFISSLFLPPCFLSNHSTTANQPLLLPLLRKEVIQPHLPIRLPCYDFTPVIRPAFGCSLLSVGSQTSGISDSHGVTGGVYKTRERIHRNILICDY